MEIPSCYGEKFMIFLTDSKNCRPEAMQSVIRKETEKQMKNI